MTKRYVRNSVWFVPFLIVCTLISPRSPSIWIAWFIFVVVSIHALVLHILERRAVRRSSDVK